MKLIRNFSMLFFAALLAVGFISCGDDEGEVLEFDTIAQIATDTPELSTLVAALERADLVATLDGDTDFTVFAPTNAAFNAFLADNGFSDLESIPVDVLRQTLLNHVVTGNFQSSSLTTGYVKTNATESNTGNNIDIFINVENGVQLNGQSRVSSADIIASNGTVHVVDAVIALPTVVTFATADANFEILTAALTRSDLTTDFVGTLSAEGPFTVFAPTNDAFGDLLAELGLSGLSDIPVETLDAVLKYHVIAGANVLSSTLTDDMEVSTLQNVDFMIDLDNGAEIVDNQGRRTSIIVTDVQSSNGVIHVINRVLLP